MRSEPHKKKSVHAWYALRRTLPPWCFERDLAELVELLPGYGVDEVIVKVDTEDFSHGHPTLDWVRAYEPNLHRLRDSMAKLGIVYSLNPWVTLCHCDRGRDARPTIGNQVLVGHDGTSGKASPCPLSESWRDYIAAVWQIYAGTGPRVIWIEDDIRTFNHDPVRFGCFCPRHLRAFAKLVGRPVTRPKLVDAMLRPGKPHPWRAQYLDMQARIMIDTVQHIAKAVHEMDPNACLGLMSSGHQYHSIEGRQWKAFGRAMADGRPLYSRPPMGSYEETSLRNLYFSCDSIKGTRHMLPAGTIEQTEVENAYYSHYANSAVFTFLEMAVSFAFGSHGVAMNLFDHTGTPMQEEPVFGQMLADAKPFLNSLAAFCQQDGQYRGVRVLHHERASSIKRLIHQDVEKFNYAALTPDGCAGAEQLEAHGIPTTYEDEPVVATSGQTIAAFDDDEIRTMLRGGLLLDATAACVLFERGFGRHIGLRRIDELGPFGAEAFFNPAFGGADGVHMTLHMRPKVSVLEPARGAQIVSRLVDPDAQQHHVCSFAYENRLGGRVAVQAFDLSTVYRIAYCRRDRARQLQTIVQWLSRRDLPLLVRGGPWPLAFRKDCGRESIVGLFNLSLDDWPGAEFSLDGARRIKRVRVLSQSGRWQTRKAIQWHKHDERMHLSCAEPVSHRRPLVMRIEWDSD